MGYEQTIVVSSPVPGPVRQAILSAAFDRWPAARAPRDPLSYPDRVVFGAPELTSYVFDGLADGDEARSQNFAIQEGLPDWSRAFPQVSFAYIEAECFGGDCSYRGYCCRDGSPLPCGPFPSAEPVPPAQEPMTPESLGRRIEARLWQMYGGLKLLLAGVGIEIETGYFEPFVRDYFADLREDQWAVCSRPRLMLNALTQLGRPLKGRKWRLLAAACLDRLHGRLRDERCRRAAEACERAADSVGGEAELIALRAEIETAVREARRVKRPPSPEEDAARAEEMERYTVLSALRDRGPVTFDLLGRDDSAARTHQAALIRDLVGNPFRPACFDPRWRTADVVRVAEGIYRDRAFDRLPALADALEAAGCADQDVLGHCRGPGPHARGCWAVDLVLGAE